MQGVNRSKNKSSTSSQGSGSGVVEQDVIVKWRGQNSATKEAFASFLEHDIFSDVCVFCDSHQFRCHRVVLAAGSEYFEHVFTETCISASAALPSVVIITRIRRDIFQNIIDYMYKGTVTLKKGRDLMDFEEAAADLKIRGRLLLFRMILTLIIDFFI